jgi:hypothetical protein
MAGGTTLSLPSGTKRRNAGLTRGLVYRFIVVRTRNTFYLESNRFLLGRRTLLISMGAPPRVLIPSTKHSLQEETGNCQQSDIIQRYSPEFDVLDGIGKRLVPFLLVLRV